MEENFNIEEKFRQGVALMLKSWPVLKMALENGWI